MYPLQNCAKRCHKVAETRLIAFMRISRSCISKRTFKTHYCISACCAISILDGNSLTKLVSLVVRHYVTPGVSATAVRQPVHPVVLVRQRRLVRVDRVDKV